MGSGLFLPFYFCLLTWLFCVSFFNPSVVFCVCKKRFCTNYLLRIQPGLESLTNRLPLKATDINIDLNDLVTYDVLWETRSTLIFIAAS